MSWITFLISFFPLWFLQNIIHEGSHALMGFLFRYKVEIRLRWLFPHFYNGRFYWASMSLYKQPDTIESKLSDLLIFSAPRISNTLVGALACLLFLSSAPVLKTLGLIFFVYQFIDGFVGSLSNFMWWKDNSYTDIGRIKKASGLSRFLLGLLNILWLSLFPIVFYFLF